MGGSETVVPSGGIGRQAEAANDLVGALGRVVLGQEPAIRETVAALLARGHVLLEGVPGTAKTLLVRTLSLALALEFRRIQFTPDLMPSDITGVNLLTAQGAFSFRPGPIFGDLVMKSVVARWTRTLSTMFAAGVPLVEALDSVGGTSGNLVFAQATQQIQRDVAAGSALTTSMTSANVFPTMVLQMSAIGEESGALDDMLARAAEFYEEEVDEMVKGLSTLMEPIIIVVLGTLIGGIVVSMYLPIFKIGQVV